MKDNISFFYLLLINTTILALCGCSSSLFPVSAGEVDQKIDIAAITVNPAFLPSGTIILSREIPAREEIALSSADEAQLLSPILGYIPPIMSFLPADNEFWLELDRQKKTISLYKGSSLLKTIPGEGRIDLAPGQYALQHKQKHPLWYAPDSYFQKRNLEVPPAGHKLRYRRGALGNYVLFPTTTFPIHSAAFWDDDVGGLRISQSDLSSFFSELPLGLSIVVK